MHVCCLLGWVACLGSVECPIANVQLRGAPIAGLNATEGSDQQARSDQDGSLRSRLSNERDTD